MVALVMWERRDVAIESLVTCDEGSNLTDDTWLIQQVTSTDTQTVDILKISLLEDT